MSQHPSPVRPLPVGLRALHPSADREAVALLTEPEAGSARCPLCGRSAKRVHSRYPMTLSDLPRLGIAVRLEVRARRFFCDESSCERTIFCERLPDIAAHGRKTKRFETALLALAFELGGEAGAGLARKLGLLVSPDTLLDRLRRVTGSYGGSVRVLGVDDFAFRKGNAYGTILVDMERREVVDLLPECSLASLSAWLQRHPGVEVATRVRIAQRGGTEGCARFTKIAGEPGVYVLVCHTRLQTPVLVEVIAP